MSFWHSFFRVVKINTNESRKKGNSFSKSLLDGFLSTIAFMVLILFGVGIFFGIALFF